MKLDKKTQTYLVIGTVGAIIIALFSSSFMNIFSDNNSVNIYASDNSVITIKPTSKAKISIYYVDSSIPVKVIESVNFIDGILSPASQTVFENGEEISHIDMTVFLAMKGFKGDPRLFEVYKTILLRIENNVGQRFEHKFLVNKDDITVSSEGYMLVTDISFTPQNLENLAELASTSSIDGSYTISIHYELAVEGKVLSGYASMPIKISTFQETTVTGEGSADVIDSGIQPGQTYDEYVETYEDKVRIYGLVDYHTYNQGWYGEKDAAGNFVFIETCFNIQILNESSDIMFHENIGAISGTCPAGTTQQEILDKVNGK